MVIMTGMREMEIESAIARYSVFHADDLEGFFGGEYYFLIGGEASGIEGMPMPFKVRNGSPIDILAEKIESREFGQLPALVDYTLQVLNPRSFRIYPFDGKYLEDIHYQKSGSGIDLRDLSHAGFSVGTGKLMIDVPRTPTRAYLDRLRNSHDFKAYAEGIYLGHDPFDQDLSKEQVMGRIKKLFA